MGAIVENEGLRHGGEHLGDFGGKHFTQMQRRDRPVMAGRGERRSDARGHGDSEIGLDQRVLKLVEGLGVELPPAQRRGEIVAERGGRAGKPAAELGEPAPPGRGRALGRCLRGRIALGLFRLGDGLRQVRLVRGALFPGSRSSFLGRGRAFTRDGSCRRRRGWHLGFRLARALSAAAGLRSFRPVIRRSAFMGCNMGCNVRSCRGRPLHLWRLLGLPGAFRLLRGLLALRRLLLGRLVLGLLMSWLRGRRLLLWRLLRSRAEQALPKSRLLIATQANILAIRALPSWPLTTASSTFAPPPASSIFTGVKSPARPRPSLSMST